jgi:RND family efflux transporter MFP subunit
MSLLLEGGMPMRVRSRKRGLLYLGGGFLALTLLALMGCDHGPPTKTAKNPKVIVTSPITDTVMDYQDFTGRLEAIKTVDLRARVSGQITDVSFKEGEFVKEGDLLFQIDVRQFQAELNQAEANLKVGIAERNFQLSDVNRARKSMASNAISREDYDTKVAAYEKAIATVGALEAARDKASLYLSYTKVTAPISGRISRRYVDPGNVILGDNTILTTIVTEADMYAYFDVDERTYLDLLALIAPGKKSWYEGLKTPVMMRLANEEDFEKIGDVDFVDNRVAATTGTVRMRGVFKNERHQLKAGLFVRIRLPIGTAYPALLIPDEAIQSDQERKYVWVVNSQGEAEYRSVNLGLAVKELRVIRPPTSGKDGKEGLTPSDRVIVSGMQRVRNGVQVDVVTQAPPPPPQMRLVKLLTKMP